jgi:hypothetical protein
MNDKEDEHLDESMFMIQMVLNDGTFMQQMIDVPMKVELDEKHLVIGGSVRITVSNPKTLMGITTHQGAWEVVVPNWHDVNYEQLFCFNSSNLHTML